jgi:O-Antigen ligase
MVALVPILILPGASFYFDVVPKIVVILLIAALAFKSLKRDVFSAILAAQAIVVLLSTHSAVSFFGSTWRREGLLVEIAILAIAAAGADCRWVAWASIPVSIYAIFEYFGVDPILNPAAYHSGVGKFMIVRPPSTMGHAAYLATFLLFVVFTTGKSKWRWLPVSLAVIAIFLSGTRGAILGLIAGAAISRIRIRYVIAAVVALAVFYFSPAGERLRARVHWSSEDALGGARLRLWRDSLRMAALRPVLGYGPETFSREFLKHESADLERAYPDFYHESPHNIFVDALVSEGILGLIPIAAIAWMGVMKKHAGFIAMLVSLQFVAFTAPTELFFYLCAGMALREGSPPGIRLRWWPVAALPFAAFAVYMGTGDVLLQSARRAADRGDFLATIRRVDLARRWHATADVYFSRRLAGMGHAALPAALQVAEFGTQTSDDPQDAWVNLAALRAAADDAAGVEQALRAAIAAAPNWYKAHWLLAEVLAREGRMSEARAEAATAADLDGGKHAEVTATRDRFR